MPLPSLSAAQRLLLAAGLCATALGTAVVAWLHAASLHGAVFLCGSAEAHCWACYAAPAFAGLAVAVIAAPQSQPTAAARS